MKKVFPFLLLAITINVKAQLLLPEFEAPVKMEAFNSKADESTPIPFNGGNSFYFYRTYVEGEGLQTEVKTKDIWFAEMKNEEWKAPYRLFRADYLEGSNFIIGASNDGQRVYLYNYTATIKKKVVTETNKLIYLDKTGRDKWTDPVEIKIPGLEFGPRYYHFHMNRGGDILMISMSPNDSLLDEDLYVSVKQKDGSWSEIIDLGEDINTNRYEVSPFIAEDGKTLYFSSAGHKGEGEADIFVSYRIGEGWTNWTKPLNLGKGINSEGVDVDFSIGNNMEIYFVSDREGTDNEIFKSRATGKFRFANQDAQFSYTNLPVDGVSLEIYDLDGNLIDEVVTDGEGNFTFRKLGGDISYVIKLADEVDEEFVGSKIYFVNEDGKKTDRFIFTNDGVFANAKDIKETQRILGAFNYNQLPLANESLVVLDENGFPIDTIYTDAEGKFEYNALAYDGKYSIVPMGLTEDKFKDLEMSILDEEGKVVQIGKLNGKGFMFEPIELDDSKLAEMNDEIAEIENNSQEIVGSAELVNGWYGKGEIKAAVYFEFAKSELTQASLQKLDELYKELGKTKIVVVGHTDDVGNAASNAKRGLARANSVVNYLVGKGFSKDLIIVASKGESKPIASNKDDAGRAKNRRVEIVVQSK